MGLAEWYDRVASRFYRHSIRRTPLVWISVFSGAGLMAYGTYDIITYGGIHILRKYGRGFWVRGDAAWVAYAGMLCTAFAFFSYALELRATVDDHQGYRRFRRWAMRAGLVLFSAGMFLGSLPGW